jgi:hypothetical protein
VDFDEKGLVKIVKEQPFIVDKAALKEWNIRWETTH